MRAGTSASAGPLAAWNWPNATFDCLLEIYQGARGSYERWRLPEGEKRGGTQTDRPGHFAQDALAKGNIYGFVSFSDHNSTHNSWAGVWVEQPTRESLFDAMLARRTFGASDEIIVRTSAAEHMPGEQFTASVDALPEIAIEVEAPDEIMRVDVVKNGEYVFTQRPGGQQASFRYRDMEPQRRATPTTTLESSSATRRIPAATPRSHGPRRSSSSISNAPPRPLDS